MIYVFSFEGTNGLASPFTVGLPLPKGTFWPEQKLQLVLEDGTPVVACISPKSLWPDKSVRWCQIEGYSTHVGTHKLFLIEGSAILLKKEDCAYEEAGKFILKSSALCLEVARDSFLSVKQTSTSGSSPLTVSPLFATEQTHTPFTLVNAEAYTQTSTCNRPLYAYLKQEYKTVLGTSSDNKSLNVNLEYKLDYQSNNLKVTLALHNPMPLVQKNGQWDLGNDNSVHVLDFGFRLTLAKSNFSVAIKESSLQDESPEFNRFTTWAMAVNNSGGDNWLSKNHVDKNGIVAQTQRGSQIIESDEKGTQKRTDMRPSPLFSLQNETQDFVTRIDNLWEKFPAQIDAKDGSLLVNFCGSPELGPVELQPGEIKLHSFSISLLADNKPPLSMREPKVTVNPDIYCASNTLPWFTMANEQNALSSIIQLGLNGERNFFSKREALDEFGWRNFGDIYADHEAVGHTGDDIFVSHYNNQYDPLQGFLKQWLLSGDPKWKKLADDLFEHIVNIDIYHTEQDKKEYNGGLFWHTDHYVEAETATHRTYSERQKTGVYEDHAGGGGPGSHHCYSSGLALYCQLTGSETAKNAVIKLGNWITYFFEGDGTLLGTLLQYRNKSIVRDPLTGRYPLDRGVANYVNVLLDSYELSANPDYMTRVSSIIRHTFHYSDDIAKRNFDDIENTWYYIVFMQSVAKYLWMCETVYGLDNDYDIIKKSFLHYVEWIAKNEQPYLLNKDKLEYPNDTWTAQDLRKIMVLTVALKYANDEILQNNIRLKIDSLKHYVEPKLLNSDEKDSTRVLALVMQNTIAEASQLTPFNTVTDAAESAPRRQYSSTKYTFTGFTWRFIKNYSFSREFKHLFIRFPQLRLK